MSRAQWSSWAYQLWDGVCHGLCATGAFLAMQNGIAMPMAGDAAARSHTTSGV